MWLRVSDEDKRQRLLQAIKEDDVTTVRALLGKGNVEINTRDEVRIANNICAVAAVGQTPLHWAISLGQLRVVEFLLSTGADPLMADKNGLTPLHWASSHGHLEIVKRVLQMSKDPNATDTNGETPLHTASRKGHLQVVEFLLKAGTDLNAANKDQQTALHVASSSGHLHVVKCLLDSDAAFNAVDTYGQTPFHKASRAGSLPVVELLMKTKADHKGTESATSSAVGSCPACGNKLECGSSICLTCKRTVNKVGPVEMTDQDDVVVSIDEQAVSDDKNAPTVGQTLRDIERWCTQASEAKTLFEQVLARLRTARNELQKLCDKKGDKDQLRHCLVSLTGELVTFANELQRYFGVRNLADPADPRTEEMFAARVLGYKKLIKTIEEIHAGSRASSTGLERLFFLLKVEEETGSKWKELFEAAASKFEKAVEDQVANSTVVDVYKANPTLALEAVTLLLYAEKTRDALQWTYNAPAKNLHEQLKGVKDYGEIALPVWFIPASDISYEKRAFAMGSSSSIHYGMWGSAMRVVVKCLLEQTESDKQQNEKLREVFLEEADLWFEISHPYLLKLYGACHVASPPFFVCEEATQGDLKEVLRRDKSMMWRLLFQSALAIDYLHGKNIVHGDLKLNNILVTKEGYARVADFGSSRFKKPSRGGTLTKADGSMEGAGALRWRAPEALNAKAQIQSDVYSFAMCIIEAIGGEAPYWNEDEITVELKIRNGELSKKPENMDNDVWELVLKMTSLNPNERATITDVIHFLKTKQTAEYDAEFERSNTKGLCPDCSTRLMDGSSVCKVCEHNVEAGMQCRGTTKRGKRCRITWDLDANQWCKYHAYQQVRSKAAHCCRNFDLVSGMCPLHTKYRSTAGPTDKSSTHALPVGEERDMLQEASKKGEVATSSALLKNENLDAGGDKDHDGKTPLHLASLEGRLQVVEYLLKNGFNPNAADKHGETALHKASNKGHGAIVELLLKTHTDSSAANKDGITPLHLAALWGHAQVADLLLKANADPDAVDKHGETPLHLASRAGYLGVVKLLLKADAEVNAVDKLGQTSLHVACKYHKSKTVRVLLAHGAELHMKDNDEYEPLHLCIQFNLGPSDGEDVEVNSETSLTLQALMSLGATWDATCDECVGSGMGWKEAPALRLCILMGAQEHVNSLPFTDVPVEVINRGVASTHDFIDALKTSRTIVLRRKICLVGSNCAGKTSFVKSITSEQPRLVHYDDRTIAIDHFPLCFKQFITSRDETKIHEVTLWDFAGHDTYQVAHSLFFSPRTLFLVFVDLEAFTTAYMQAVVIANEDFQETRLLDESVEHAMLRWVRLILARQPDAEFVFIAAKDDVLKENTVTESLLKDKLMEKLQGVGTVVDQMQKAANQDVGDWSSASIRVRDFGVASKEPRVIFTSCTSPASIRTARFQVEELITKSNLSIGMTDTYAQALGVIVKIRQEANTLGITERIERVFARVETLPALLEIEPEMCHVILRALHDLGDVLWYKDLGVALFQYTVILDPLLLIDFIRQVVNYKTTGVTIPHSDLKTLPYWMDLSSHQQMKAMKHLLHKFCVVYPCNEDGVMEWDSDLIVPALWQTKIRAMLKFLGDMLCINTTMSREGEAVRVDWEFIFDDGLPPTLFDRLIVASVSPSFTFEAGPDWILYNDKEAAAWRITVGRDRSSLHQTIHIEAVVAETANKKQVDKLWWTFQRVCGALVRVYPGLAGLSSFALDENQTKINLKQLLQSTTPYDTSAGKWMPPATTWWRFNQLTTQAAATAELTALTDNADGFVQAARSAVSRLQSQNNAELQHRTVEYAENERKNVEVLAGHQSMVDEQKRVKEKLSDYATQLSALDTRKSSLLAKANNLQATIRQADEEIALRQRTALSDLIPSHGIFSAITAGDANRAIFNYSQIDGNHKANAELELCHVDDEMKEWANERDAVEQCIAHTQEELAVVHRKFLECESAMNHRSQLDHRLTASKATDRALTRLATTYPFLSRESDVAVEAPTAEMVQQCLADFQALHLLPA